MKWIKTKDELPTERTPVLIFNGSEWAHAIMRGDKWYLMNTYPEIWIDKGLPTHWAIPELPKE